MWTDDVVSFKRQTDLRMRKFSAFNHSACNRVLNLLEAIYLRHRKIVVHRVTVVEFGFDDKGSDGLQFAIERPSR